MTQVIINGASGKMGRAICDIIAANPSLGMQVVAKLDADSTPYTGVCDLVIDFSLPIGAQQAFALAKAQGVPFLSGTTNLPQSFIEQLKTEREIPVFYSPNVSIGVYLFTQLIKQAAAYYSGYSQAMHEVHHTQKVDAPSGTAKSLAAAINFPSKDITYERTGTVPGTHSLVLNCPMGLEKITIKHEALDRKLFAQSAVKVAAWLRHQKPGFYDMHNFTEAL